MVIRTQREGLEGEFEKNGKYLPLADLDLTVAMGKVIFSKGVLAPPKLEGGGMRVVAKSSLWDCLGKVRRHPFKV